MKVTRIILNKLKSKVTVNISKDNICLRKKH